MQQFINENKQFLLTVCGGATVFLICMYFISGIYGQVDDIKGDIQLKQQDIERRLEKLNPPEGSSGLRQERAKAPTLRDKIFPQTKKETLFTPSVDFQWKKGTENAGLVFTTKRSQVYSDIKQLAQRKNFVLEPSGANRSRLGFTRSEITAGEIEEYLKRLELVKLLMEHVILSGLKEVKAMKSDVRTKSVAIPGTRYEVVRLPIRLELVGKNRDVINFLSRLSKTKDRIKKEDPEAPDLPHLELIKFSVRSSSTSQWLVAKIEVAALSLKKLKDKVEAKGSKKKSGKKSRWGSKMIRKLK